MTAGRPWSSKDDRQLAEWRRLQLTIAIIAARTGRDAKDVKARIEHLRSQGVNLRKAEYVPGQGRYSPKSTDPASSDQIFHQQAAKRGSDMLLAAMKRAHPERFPNG